MGWESRAREGAETGLITPLPGSYGGQGFTYHAFGKIVLAYPTGNSVTTPFHGSVLRLAIYETEKEKGRRLAKVYHTAGLYVADNRTLLVQRFLKTWADWLLQVDTDVEFPRTLLETMIGIAGPTRKVLSASVPLGEKYPSSAFTRDPLGRWMALPPPPAEPIEVEGIATAVLLVHRSVFETIARGEGQSWFHHMYIPKHLEKLRNAEGVLELPPAGSRSNLEYESIGEDLAFSARVRAYGFKIHCVHVPGLRHYKVKGLSHDDEITRRKALLDDDSIVGEIVEEGG